jgi:hypothetical protein
LFAITSTAALELDESKFNVNISDQEERLTSPKPPVCTKEDDATIEAFIKNIGTAWHLTSTCAMKGRADGGVVDERLDV